MNDAGKTKNQLLSELKYLQKRLAECEKQNASNNKAITSLRKLAYIDELTSLYNRRGFLEFGQKILSFSKREKEPVMLLFGGIDNLKIINDLYGHLAGDQALKEVAGLLKKAFRETDVISRIGGDEFAVLATINDELDAELLTSRLHNAVNDYNKGQRGSRKISLSLGTAISNPAQSITIKDMVRLADEAMYSAKRKQNHNT